jgi:hypothetical protein
MAGCWKNALPLLAGATDELLAAWFLFDFETVFY